MTKTALIIGASGLVGSECLKLLLAEENISHVKVLVRKQLALSHPKLEQHIIDFNQLTHYSPLITADYIFCCIGSTTKKVKGNKKEYEKIDRIYPRQLAEIALQNGASHFLIVSAMGANASSSIFYNQLKGLVEDDLQKLTYKALSIFRPSLLLGNRNEIRPAEKLAMLMFKVINPLLIGSLRKYRSIEAETVARAMVKVSLTKHEGFTIYPSDVIEALVY